MENVTWSDVRIILSGKDITDQIKPITICCAKNKKFISRLKTVAEIILNKTNLN
jgi:hypothetical protein